MISCYRLTEIHLPLSLRLEAGDFFRKMLNNVIPDERSMK
ncbi:hypothetical protein GCM10008932_08270 [Alkalibacterium iburiense]|uniref:Uncharacterized protein n=1 Tax=Alkalibacterium iburiense TaxID=290589 RepID=A0ABN0X8H0_9LACT